LPKLTEEEIENLDIPVSSKGIIFTAKPSHKQTRKRLPGGFHGVILQSVWKKHCPFTQSPPSIKLFFEIIKEAISNHLM
jgi:hypothetical protein